MIIIYNIKYRVKVFSKRLQYKWKTNFSLFEIHTFFTFSFSLYLFEVLNSSFNTLNTKNKNEMDNNFCFDKNSENNVTVTDTSIRLVYKNAKCIFPSRNDSTKESSVSI